MADKTPYRVVDRNNQGWHAGRAGPEGGTSYDDLAAARGPLRPVLPISDADRAEFERLFRQVGRKTITTLAAALEAVFYRIREDRWAQTDISESWSYARRTLMAGREGSWESELLIEIVTFGNGLNLAKPTRQMQDVDERRKAGPSSRVDHAVRDAMAEIFTRWVTAPDRYTEVAETLAGMVSRYCDDLIEQALPDSGPAVFPAGWKLAGWRAIADQWLQPGGLTQADFSRCYRLFCSQSDCFDSSVI
jgi:hypothetical protein